MWKEMVLLHLGWIDIDYAIRKDEPPTVTNTSTEAEISLYEHWEQSNRLSVMFIKTKISAGICGLVDHHTKVRDLLKAIDEEFVTSDKALASTLIMKFCSTRLDTVRGNQPSTSSNGLIVVHNTPSVQIGVEQPIIEVPQVADIIQVG
ncbi:hypothetical protein F0562_030675 [Nyssa sinensis]|uniref:Uncharacterized protein n=1 Tax=Nyssa sinensis TaxID=561372 RepID=A0A5J5B1B9_9ASTE|nr:hypothetical protein F0562_030675 [Nyssa sinensis]